MKQYSMLKLFLSRVSTCSHVTRIIIGLILVVELYHFQLKYIFVIYIYIVDLVTV